MGKNKQKKLTADQIEARKLIAVESLKLGLVDFRKYHMEKGASDYHKELWRKYTE